jgi:hypothetical protein
MVLTPDHTLNIDQIAHRVRLLTSISSTDMSEGNLSEVISMAIEWFQSQTGLTYTVDSDDSYDMAVIYYSCYLGSIIQNGMGIEQMRIGDVFIQYSDEEPYNQWLEMANNEIVSKQGLSIKTSTYNADSSLGDVDWKKNIDGSSSTLNVRQKPRNM